MSEGKPARWVRVAATGDLAEGEMLAVQVGDESVAVYRLDDGSFHATDNICTHEYACLHEGWLEGGVVECPLHAGQFDVRTGKALCPPVEVDLRVYPVRIEGEDVLAEVPGA